MFGGDNPPPANIPDKDEAPTTPCHNDIGGIKFLTG
jgi:hypothetical protein